MVYLLHFSRPLSHASHYVGFTTNHRTLALRLQHHREGRGGRLPGAAAAAGIEFHVSRLWEEGDRSFERKLHNKNHPGLLCPICRDGIMEKRRATRRARYHQRKAERAT